jgi:peptidoglycan L-alanyl-D-glutamate endopeptidase CwlK
MPSFGDKSKKVLLELHTDLRAVLNSAIKYIDFSVVCGYRGKRAQNTAFAAGNSKLKYPHSKHNAMPALAVDIVPYKAGRDAQKSDYLYLAGYIMAVAKILLLEGRIKHVVRWGGDWNMDDYTSDETFLDAGHFELK